MTSQTITLNASADYGHAGQYICKITGRAPKVQFERSFCGTKHGKRNDRTSYETDETGLYETQDATRKGKNRSYYLILPWNDGLVLLKSDHEDALLIAKRLDGAERLEDFVVVERDPLTKSESRHYCSQCEAELTRDSKCTEHPDAAVSLRSVEVQQLNEDGSPKHRLVYAIRTPGEVKKVTAAANLDTAVNAICEALAALPQPMQKQALKQAKNRLFPPTEEPENLPAVLT